MLNLTGISIGYGAYGVAAGYSSAGSTAQAGVGNPWWRAGAGIDPEEAAWPRRAHFPHFCRLALEVGVRRAVLLIGPRRVGKTVMLKHLVKRLLDDGVARAQRSCMPLLTHRSTQGEALRAWCDRS